MSRFRVVVTDDRFGSYAEENAVLREIDSAVEVLRLGDEAETIAGLRDADAVFCNLHPLTAAVIRSLGCCRVISRYGVGYDNADVEAATAAGIWVARVPDYCTEDVSDHALALLLACVRRIPFVDRRVREGGWNLRSEQSARRIAGKTLGIVGYGRAGARCTARSQGWAWPGCWSATPSSTPATSWPPAPFRSSWPHCWPKRTTYPCTPR